MQIYRYYIFIGVLGFISLVLIIIGIFIVGSPIDQKGREFDFKRSMDFNNIKTSISLYFDENKSLLPGSLDQLSTYYNSTIDPETKKPYVYKIISNTSYELCATFANSSEVDNKYDLAIAQIKHKRGYDCVKFDIPLYYQSNPIPTISPEISATPSATPTSNPFPIAPLRR